MKQEQVNYKVTLIGEQDLSKLSAEEMALLIAAYIEDMRKWLDLPIDGQKRERRG